MSRLTFGKLLAFWLLLGAAPPPGAFLEQRPISAMYRDGWIDLNENGRKDPYEDPARNVEARITDLLGRMTLEEKTAQMVTLYGFGRVLKDELPTPAWESSLWKDGIGNIDEQSNGNTGTEHNLPDPKYDYPWAEHARALNEIQRWFVERTRLGIPVDFTNEGIRGLLHTKATSFPAQLAVASTWNRALVREVGRITGREARALGYTNVYSPVLDLARDPRWGRVVETYGEDPFLVSELGVQQVSGIQEAQVVSTLKHFGVYSVPQGGRDGDARTDPHATWSELQTVLLAPFRRAIREGHALGVMASYNDYDGVPVIASPQFLTEILRKEYGFQGYVVSDSGAVEFVHQKHRVAPTPSDAILAVVQAGMNVRTNFTPPEAFVLPLRELVKSGRLPLAVIDARVRDVLRVKYWLGLFDAPYVLEPEAASRVVRAAFSLKVAQQAAHEAIILLKNEGKLLPLARSTSKVLVAGPLADDLRAWWCRYGPQRLDFVTPLAGIRQKLGAHAEVRYVKGVDARDANWPESDIYREGMPPEVRAGIAAAVKAAAGVDVILLAVGEPEELSRESRSRISLDLPGYQQDLLRALQATGVPLVVIVSSGRPQSINFAARHARAIVNVWYLGENGGSALADVLFGEYNPGGRLPITVPRSVGQLPYNFPFKPGSHGRDEGQVSGPLYAFGHGLSYTQFEYSRLQVAPERIERTGNVSVSVDVRNVGPLAGDEVVQLYVRDDYGSVTTFERSLRGFERIHLAPGQTRRVSFQLGPEQLALYDAHRRWTVEPGRFTLLVGASSVDIRQTGSFSVEAPDGSVPVEAPIAPVIVP